MESDETRGRRRGAIIGLAVGDALGAAVEFEPPGTFIPVTGFRGGGVHGVEPGEWTDDTCMALALADSIADVGWDLADQAERYLSWWKGGRYTSTGRVFDIGQTTLVALQRFRETGDPRSGDPSPWASGNESIMRLAPVPVAYFRLWERRRPELIDRLVASSLTTHASPQCVSSCAAFGLILAGLVVGATRDEVLSPDWPPLRELRERFPLHPEVDDVMQGSYRRKQPPEIRGSGYVVASLEAALWGFCDATDFRDAVLRCVNLGDDADTTGAVCGQLAGAYWGEDAIPIEWRDGLLGRAVLDDVLDRLIR